MIDKHVRYHYSEVGIVPAVTSRINSRSKVNPYYGSRELPEDIHFPIFTAPMASVVNAENYDEWKKSRVLPIIPRTEDVKVRSSFSRKGAWVAWSLQEFIKYFVNWNHKEHNSYPPMINPYGPTNILIDIANGHMSTLLRAVKTVKTTYKMLEKRLNIMVGNIANPETYAQYCDAGVDYVRVSIGTGSQCITSANTGVHYPIASLLDEINRTKQERISYRLPYAKVVADGGITRYDYAIKALALGADYVMIGSLFAGMLESAADYMKQEILEDGKMKIGVFDQKFDELNEMLHPTQNEPAEDDTEEPLEPIAKSVWNIGGVECPLQTDDEGFGYIEYFGVKYEIMMDEDAEQVPENCYVIIPMEDGKYKFSNYGEVVERIEEADNTENPDENDEPASVPTTPITPAIPTFTIEQHGEFVKTIMKKTWEGEEFDVFCKLETGELFFFDTNSPEEYTWMKPYDAIEEGDNTNTDPDPETPDTPVEPTPELDMESWKVGGVTYEVYLDEDGKTRYMMISIDGELVKTIIKTDYLGDYISKYTDEGEAKIRDHGHTYEAPEIELDDEDWLNDAVEVPSEDDQQVIKYAACNSEKCNCNKADDNNAEDLDEFAYGLTKEEAEDFISLFNWEEDEYITINDVEKFKNMPEQYKRAFLKLVTTAKENYGMSTKRAQKEMGGSGDKSSEGIESLVMVEYTRAQWLDNMKNYLRSAMSYCDAFNLKEFVGHPTLVVLSEGDQMNTNK